MPLEYRGSDFCPQYFLILKKKGAFFLSYTQGRVNKWIHCSTFSMVILASIIPSLQAQNRFEALDPQNSYFPIASHPAPQDIPAIRNGAQSLSVQNASICHLHSTRRSSQNAQQQWQMRYSHISIWRQLDYQRKISSRSCQSRELFRQLGFMVNYDKQCLIPAQRTEFVGALIDSK